MPRRNPKAAAVLKPDILAYHARMMRHMLRVEEINGFLDRELDRFRYVHTQLLAATDIDPQSIEEAMEDDDSDTDTESEYDDDDDDAADEVDNDEILVPASSPPPAAKSRRRAPTTEAAKLPAKRQR